MFYSPLFDFYRRFEGQVNDIGLELLFYIVAALVDSFARDQGFDRPALSLLVLLFCYVSARLIIKFKRADEHFNTFGKHKLYYVIAFAIFSWGAYLLMIRPRIR